jgi:membrane protein
MDAKGRDAESPWTMPWAGWRAVAIRTWNESGDDNIGLIAAGVAFYGFLAIAPMLAAVVLCYGIVASPETVIRDMQALMAVMPRDAARTIGQQLLDLVHASDGKKGTGIAIALALALFGARNGAGAVITALNVAYEEKEKRNFIRVNLTALAITAAGVIGAILAAIATAALGALDRLLPFADDTLLILGTVLSYVLLTLAGAAGAAALYRYGPSRHKARWTWITPGSLFSAVLWLGLALGFGAYVRYVGKFDATYGSLGAVVALLTWLYLSAYVLLFGAELNSELEHQTAADTTTGPEHPMGDRRAWVADHVADAEKDPPPGPRVPPAPLALPPAADAPIVQAADTGPVSDFAASRAIVRVGRAAGLPKIGWISSGLASIGLSMLRRRGGKAAGAVMLAAAAGLSLLRKRA